MHWGFYFIYFGLGAAIGCFSGLLGLGGGLIVVPVLHWIFKSIPEMAPYHMHIAISTSLAVMIFTSISSTYFHAKRKSVLWDVFMKMALGMLAGAFAGPIVSDEFSSRALEIIFGCIEVLIAVLLLVYKPKGDSKHPVQSPSLRTLLIILTGFIAAFVGSMLGIGGGVIIVPALVFLGYTTTQAIGTSAAGLILTSVVGSASQLLFSLNLDIPLGLGFIYLPATIGLAIGSLIFAPLGVKLAHKLDGEHLKKIFIFVLLAIGILMLT